MVSLEKSLTEYLKLQRTLGFKLKDADRFLRSFISFLKDNRSSIITTKLAFQWATQPANAQSMYHASRLCMVRHFAQYRITQDPRTQIPPAELLPFRYNRKTPYIYTDKEIKRLLKSTKYLRSETPFKARTYSTLFGLVAVTGMRISEALNLNSNDVDLSDNIITVRESKFGKSRLVPIHQTTQRVLKRYSNLRDKIYPKSWSFFVSENNTPLNYQAVRRAFIKLSRKVGSRGKCGQRDPHLHDVRHRFAISTLIGWYRRGVDVEKYLPVLATFLGHVKISYTYWYLSATPELLRLAAKRLDKTKGDKLS